MQGGHHMWLLILGMHVVWQNTFSINLATSGVKSKLLWGNRPQQYNRGVSDIIDGYAKCIIHKSAQCKWCFSTTAGLLVIPRKYSVTIKSVLTYYICSFNHVIDQSKVKVKVRPAPREHREVPISFSLAEGQREVTLKVLDTWPVYRKSRCWHRNIHQQSPTGY